MKTSTHLAFETVLHRSFSYKKNNLTWDSRYMCTCFYRAQLEKSQYTKLQKPLVKKYLSVMFDKKNMWFLLIKLGVFVTPGRLLSVEMSILDSINFV